MVRGYYAVLDATNLPNGYDGLCAWLANYVMNPLRTGHGRTRSASSLRGLYASLTKHLTIKNNLRLTEYQRDLLDRQLDGIMVRHADSSMAGQSEEISAADIDKMYECLSEMDISTPAKRRRQLRLHAALQTGLVLWQGVLRFGDIRSVQVSWVLKKTIGGHKCFIIRYKGKTTRHSSKYKMAVIPKRADRFDAYHIVKDCMQGNQNLLFRGVTAGHIGALTKWASAPEVLNKKVTGHGFRVGGHNALAQVCENERFLNLQGGWGTGTSDSFARVYDRIQASHVTWAAAMGAE